MRHYFSLRKVLLLFADIVGILFSCFTSYFAISYAGTVRFETYHMYSLVITYVLFNVLGLIAFRVYDNLWRYANIRDFFGCCAGIITGNLVYYLANYFLKNPIPHMYVLVNLVLTLIIVIGIRIIYRVMYDRVNKYIKSESKKRTLVIGAGAACKIILTEMRVSSSEYNPVCVVDDDPQKIHRMINGIRIYGPTDLIPDLCRKFQIQTILFAIPSCSDEQRKRILKLCAETGCDIRIIPYLHDIIIESKLLHQVKNIRIEDLLGRESICLDDICIQDSVRGKVCMVTGGGGSIGSELCRQIAKSQPKQLIIVDNYENNAYDIQQELLRKYSALRLSVEIVSVRDLARMDSLFRQYRPDIVYHAAAHKHVPLMENNPEQAVKNNVFGTYNVASLAYQYKIKTMVLISSDKAVNPTNAMGATKRCCEMIMQYMAQRSTSTNFVSVRFGNVLGSNGSVVPLFRKQIEDGGPVTVTHPDIIRYFMTIPEAVSLVLQAGAMAKGGEIFVLDMGEPVKITTLAENLIRLYGYEPYLQMPIIFTGLRPGEKLFEELLMSEEGLRSTANEKIFVGNQIKIDPEQFLKKLKILKEAAYSNEKEQVLQALHYLVPTFQHESEIPAAILYPNPVPAEENLPLAK